ncbi:hypothetical protein BCR33DRAFT_858202 [Rhizoclosmatium globosum]|uniref:BZIP domain-containing protein n=1 Tax=Rhizoclosmatium globosum TaxID=329046 RepID=A0A1Y2B055_9FUNG|nr:hypothetical protein BCR33DRAFT_858202 [Rhizoclosmatium globosum]|eukprot:ORY28116.1 hypothetical protein BCR33DRAFT_858202 [Rhizoclosmatium globosum]
MDSGSPSPSTSASTDSSSQPKKVETRGRKKLPNTEANAARRSLQLKEAQRVHREKKIQHLKDLEDTITQLREENKQVQALREQVKSLQFEMSVLKGSLTCLVCSTALKAVVPSGQDAVNTNTLGSDVTSTASSVSETCGGVSYPPVSISPESDILDFQMTELDAFLNSVVPKMLTSEELYGPVEVDAGRLLVRTIPSLKGSRDLDRMFDLMIQNSRAADLPTAKRIKLQSIRTMGRIMEQTSVEDRPMLFEVMAVIQERNIHHYRYTNTLWGTLLPVVSPFIIDPTNKIHRLMLEYQPRFLQIPSLSTAINEVNEFCFTWARSVDTQDTTSFARIHICVERIVLLCSVKDRAEFFSLFFELKGRAKDEMEELLVKIEAASLY